MALSDVSGGLGKNRPRSRSASRSEERGGVGGLSAWWRSGSCGNTANVAASACAKGSVPRKASRSIDVQLNGDNRVRGRSDGQRQSCRPPSTMKAIPSDVLAVVPAAVITTVSDGGGSRCGHIPPIYEAAIAAVERFGWREVHGNNREWTALHWAATEGRTDICARLLRARADPKQIDHSGRAALDYAYQMGHALTWRILAGDTADTRSRSPSVGCSEGHVDSFADRGGCSGCAPATIVTQP
eukprot:TRINITY_DN42329_c0_g1_i1.p1 TRINITY_DN42329_c0_g1~~TRINITY_DN42329_c0_g1_i1.p1  ORF type:complete len:274 (+),score=32.33 TRINITY_DN42329_c0_g1_i1:99-824(+)